MPNADPVVRNLAVKALGLCCLLNKETAQKHLPLFIQVMLMDTIDNIAAILFYCVGGWLKNKRRCL